MITIAAIVEGFGEVRAFPVLLRRVAAEAGVHDIHVPEPFRVSRSKITDLRELERACVVSSVRIQDKGCVLIVVDADDDCAVDLAKTIRAMGPNLSVPLYAVVASREFESLFLAASPSLVAAGRLSAPYSAGDPELVRGAKEVLRELIKGGVYRETVHQAGLCGAMSLAEARRCRWFRKLESDLRGVFEP